VPFPLFTFSTANALTAVNQEVNVQKPFRGQRIVANVQRTAVGNEASRIVTMSDLRIANVPQPAAAGDTPIEAFAGNAFGLHVDLDSSQPGVIYRVTLNIQGAVTGAGGQIDVSVAIFGFTLR
jgi:hypothetical protein